MKQTAVEWLVEQWPILESQIPERILDQAKLIEIDQMRAVHLMTWMNRDFDFEQYIKEQ
jgi:hypothetical protein